MYHVATVFTSKLLRRLFIRLSVWSSSLYNRPVSFMWGNSSQHETVFQKACCWPSMICVDNWYRWNRAVCICAAYCCTCGPIWLQLRFPWLPSSFAWSDRPLNDETNRSFRNNTVWLMKIMKPSSTTISCLGLFLSDEPTAPVRSALLSDPRSADPGSVSPPGYLIAVQRRFDRLTNDWPTTLTNRTVYHLQLLRVHTTGVCWTSRDLIVSTETRLLASEITSFVSRWRGHPNWFVQRRLCMVVEVPFNISFTHESVHSGVVSRRIKHTNVDVSRVPFQIMGSYPASIRGQRSNIFVHSPWSWQLASSSST